MTLTADYQAELRGVVLGPSSDYPHAAAPQGFGTPSYRTGDQPRPLDHGEFAGLDLMNGRTVVFDVWVVGDDDTEAAANLNALKAAFAPSSATLELSVRLAGTDYALLGRPRGVVANIEYVRDGVARARCEFKALDPRLYSLEVTDSPLVLASNSGAGLEFPLTFPMTFGGAATGGVVTVENAGTFTAPWVAVINGPVVDPFLENTATGEIVRLTGTLDAGDYLVVDSDARTVLLNGTASRYSWVSPGSTWWQLEPGANSVRYGATSGSGTGTLTSRSVWI